MCSSSKNSVGKRRNPKRFRKIQIDSKKFKVIFRQLVEIHRIFLGRANKVSEIVNKFVINLRAQFQKLPF